MAELDLISTTEAAAILGVHPVTLRGFVTSGRLRGFTIPGRGHRVFVSKAEVEKLAEPVEIERAPAPGKKRGK